MKTKYIPLLFMIIILMACTPKLAQRNTPTIQRSTITPSRPAITVTHTSTRTLTPTSTNTSTPTLTITPPPPTPTWTPIPTLNGTDGFNILMSYFVNNGGCQLPCWWGIIPGQTTWEEARNRLSIISEEIGPYTVTTIPSYYYSFSIPMYADPIGYGYFEPELWVDQNIVYGINLNTGWIQKGVVYTLSKVLIEFGQPDEIWIDLQTDVMDKPHYKLELFYPRLGMMFASYGDGEFVESSVEICPRNFKYGNFPAAVILFSPSNEISFIELEHMLFDWSANEFRFVKLNSISDGFDEAAFYETYVELNTVVCFEVEGSKP